MKLGNFSVSLSVKDIHVSREFYHKLGFEDIGGDISQNWLVMQNENCRIGIFQDMFEGNILTFNPGWDEKTDKLEEFTDVRDIQKQLKADGLELETEADESTSGPGYLILKDPDGNVIMLDQHV